MSKNSSNMCPLLQQVMHDVCALVVVIITIISVVVIVVVIVVRPRRCRGLLELSPAGHASRRRPVGVSSMPPPTLSREPFDGDTATSRADASAQLESDNEDGATVAKEQLEEEAQAHGSSECLSPIVVSALNGGKSFDEDVTQSLSPAPAERASQAGESSGSQQPLQAADSREYDGPHQRTSDKSTCSTRVSQTTSSSSPSIRTQIPETTSSRIALVTTSSRTRSVSPSACQSLAGALTATNVTANETCLQMSACDTTERDAESDADIEAQTLHQSSSDTWLLQSRERERSEQLLLHDTDLSCCRTRHSSRRLASSSKLTQLLEMAPRHRAMAQSRSRPRRSSSSAERGTRRARQLQINVQ